MPDILEIDRLIAGYGGARVISDVSLNVAEGECVAVLGRNGMGKTTLLNSIIGTTSRHGGRIGFRGRDITALQPYQRARAGIAWVPQERNIFASLTVEENLTAVARRGRWTVPTVFDVFPRLRERRTNLGTQLSGGEQQMLAIGRALMLNTPMLLLDEPTEGLAPVLVNEVFSSLRRLIAEEGISAVIVEHQAKKVLSLSHRTVVMERGRIVWTGSSAGLLTEPGMLNSLLGVGRSNEATDSPH